MENVAEIRLLGYTLKRYIQTCTVKLLISMGKVVHMSADAGVGMYR